MRWLIFALGVALALGGAASIVSGVPYIRIEFGWTEVIAGTTALSAGIVTVALGAVLSALRSLELRLVESRPAADVPDLAFSQAEPMSLPTVATVLADDGSDAALHEPDVTPPTFVERDMTPVPASRPLMGRVRSKLSTMGTPGNDRAEPSVPLGPSPATERSSGVRPAASLAQRDGGEASYRRPPGVDQPELAPSRSYASPSVAPSTRAVTDDRVPSLIPSLDTPPTWMQDRSPPAWRLRPWWAATNRAGHPMCCFRMERSRSRPRPGPTGSRRWRSSRPISTSRMGPRASDLGGPRSGVSPVQFLSASMRDQARVFHRHEA